MAARGPSAVPLGEPADVTMAEAAEAAEPPEADSPSMVALEPDERSEASSESELDDWEWLRHYDVFMEANFMPPRDSAQPDEWRARREAVTRMRKEA